MKITRWIGLFFLMLSSYVAAQVVESGCTGGNALPVFMDSIRVTVLVDSTESDLVKIAADLLCQDIELVTNHKPKRSFQVDPAMSLAIIVGSVSQSSFIQELAGSGKLNIDSLAGKWERFSIKTIDTPIEGIDKALVITGSDRRGTAYGIFELSKAIGVSPWYWWADVTPVHLDSLIICEADYLSKEPGVQYRGIFINDEDWGLQEWAQYTFDTVNDIGPETYEKVFELLLRLKANCIWPAMHPSTKPFNYYAGNRVMADKYGIIMGSSHHEPLLYNTYEWPYPVSEWNPFTNMDLIMGELENRVQSNGMYENIYTVGIRGAGDGSISGGSTLDEKTAKLEEVIDRQRDLLKEHVDPDISSIPQVFWPYKEVMDQYNNNMELPDDITLGWVDDNYGYVRQVSDPIEQDRSGGSGVYYHLSYWGSPADYLWIASTQPALIATEMKKAAAFGGNRIWIFNVGDIKPAEMLMNFCLDLAWDYQQWDAGNVKEYLRQWSTQNFGESYAEDIASAYMKYFQLAQAAKPEHINRVKFPDDQIDNRLQEYEAIAEQVEVVYNSIPDELKDAFFETVYYPIVCAGLMNRKFLYAYKSFRGAVTGDTNALVYSQKATDAYNTIHELTNYYNTGIKSGKWNKIISADIRSQAVYDMPDVADQSDVDKEYAELADINLAEGKYEAPMQYVDGLVYGNKPGMQTASSGGIAEYTFELEKAIDAEVYFYARTPTPEEDSWYIDINGIQFIQNDYATGDIFEWIKVKSQTLVAGTNTIRIGQREPNAQIAAIKITEPGLLEYSENYVRMPDTIIPASTFSTMQNAAGYTWKVVEGLSTSEKAVMNLPYTASSIHDINQAPYIEQQIELESSSITLEVRCMPTRRLYEGRDLRIGISLNDEEPIVQSIYHPYPTKVWENNVLHGYTATSINYTADNTYLNVKLFALDPGIIIDRVLIYYNDAAEDTTRETSLNKPPAQTGDARVRIYPNPCNEKINCVLKNIEEGNLEFTVTDLTGRELIKDIYTVDSHDNVLEIPTSEISYGNYIVTVAGNKKIYLNALLVKK